MRIDLWSFLVDPMTNEEALAAVIECGLKIGGDQCHDPVARVEALRAVCEAVDLRASLAKGATEPLPRAVASTLEGEVLKPGDPLLQPQESKVPEGAKLPPLPPAASTDPRQYVATSGQPSGEPDLTGLQRLNHCGDLR